LWFYGNAKVAGPTVWVRFTPAEGEMTMSDELVTTYRGYAIQRLYIGSYIGSPAVEANENDHHTFDIFNPKGLNVGRESSLEQAQCQVDVRLKTF
jgi:hypothetical protein